MAAAPRKRPSNRNRRKVPPQELDLPKYNRGPGVPEQYNDGSTGMHLPNDVPLYVRAFRLLGEFNDATDGHVVGSLEGWTVQLDAWTFGVKVFLRIGMDGTLKLFIEDHDGRQKLVEWEK